MSLTGTVCAKHITFFLCVINVSTLTALVPLRRRRVHCQIRFSVNVCLCVWLRFERM